MASKSRAVLEALQVALEANHSGTVYRPDVVQPMLDWPDETALDSSLGTIYLIRPVREVGVLVESCTVTKRLQVLILAAHRYTSPSDNPFKEDPPRWQVSADLAADVEEKLRRDEKLGGEALTTFDGPIGVDHERYYLPKWVVPEIEVFVRYRYEKAER